MRTSCTIRTAVYIAEQRFNALIDAALLDRSVAQVAIAHRCAPSTLNLQKNKVLAALTPKKPDPKRARAVIETAGEPASVGH